MQSLLYFVSSFCNYLFVIIDSPMKLKSTIVATNITIRTGRADSSPPLGTWDPNSDLNLKHGSTTMLSEFNLKGVSKTKYYHVRELGYHLSDWAKYNQRDPDMIGACLRVLIGGGESPKYKILAFSFHPRTIPYWDVILSRPRVTPRTPNLGRDQFDMVIR